MQRRGAVYLPPELWEMIIGSITDCNYLPRVWLNFRRVSRTFKGITERVFSSKHLRYSRITNVGLDFFVITPKGGFVRVTDKRLMLDFDRLSDDGERAVFSEKHFTSSGDLERQVLFDQRLYKVEDILDGFRGGWPAAHKRTMRKALQHYSLTEERLDDFSLPHIFSLRRIANDTDLPGAEYDFEGLEMSFLWKPALTKFLGEEEYMRLNWDDLLKGALNPTMEERYPVPDCSRGGAGASMCYPMEPREVLRRMRTKRIQAEYRRSGKGRIKTEKPIPDRIFTAKETEVFAFRDGFRKSIIKDEWIMRQDGDGDEEGDFCEDDYPAPSPLPMTHNENSDPCDPDGPCTCDRLSVPQAIVNKSYFFNYD